MSLISCAECGNPISTLAAACPKCGAPMQAASPAVKASPPAPGGIRPPPVIVAGSPAPSANSKAVVFIVLAVIGLIGLVQLAPRTESHAVVESPPVPTVDLTRPVFTKQNATVCPASVVFDKRAGHDLRAATDAATTVFGKAKAVEQVGCEVWHDGVELRVSEKSSSADAWIPANDKRSSSIVPVMVWTYDLRN
jgi:hypothetical protein